MVAPIDAKTSFEVEGETITLRLNFRALSLAKKEGVDLMGGGELDPFAMATLVRCMAVQDHPNMDDEEAFAIIVKGKDDAMAAIGKLTEDFGGKMSAEGKVPKKKPAK